MEAGLGPSEPSLSSLLSFSNLACTDSGDLTPQMTFKPALRNFFDRLSNATASARYHHSPFELADSL